MDLPEDLLEDIFRKLNLVNIYGCRCTCKLWNMLCLSPSFVNRNTRLVPYQMRWPLSSPRKETRRWLMFRRKSFLTYVRLFGRALEVLDLDNAVQGSMGWSLTQKQLLFVLKHCPNLDEFCTREPIIYPTSRIRLLSQTNISRLFFTGSELILNEKALNYLGRMGHLRILALHTDYTSRACISDILEKCPDLHELSILNAPKTDIISKGSTTTTTCSLKRLELLCSAVTTSHLHQLRSLTQLTAVDLSYSLHAVPAQHILDFVMQMHNLVFLEDLAAHGPLSEYLGDNDPTWLRIRHVLRLRQESPTTAP